MEPQVDRSAPPGIRRPALAADARAADRRDAGQTGPGGGNLTIATFAFVPHGETIATIQIDGRVGLRNATGVMSTTPSWTTALIPRGLAFSADGRSLAVGGSDRDVFVYDVGAGGAGRPLGMPICIGNGLAISPDGRLLAAANRDDPEILLWDVAAGRERARLRGHVSHAISLAFAPERTVAGLGGAER